MDNEKSIIDLAREAQEAGASQAPQDTPYAKAPELNTGNFSNVPQDNDMQGALEGLLENVHDKLKYVKVELPSRGVFYPKAEEPISVRPLTFDDERNLRNMNTDNMITVLTTILGACTKGVDVSLLTPPDRLFLLFKVRELSYGDDYKIEQNCDNCGVKNSLTLKLSTLETNYLEDDYTVFELPDSKKEVRINVPRASQLENIDMDKLMNDLYKYVQSVSDVVDPTIIEEFIRRTTVRDVDVLRNKIFIPPYGMEDKLIFNCMKCSQTTKAAVTLNEYFFTAS